MRYTAAVQSLAQLFEAVSLHQLLVGGSRYVVVRAFLCLLFAQLFPFLLTSFSSSFLSLPPFLFLCLYIILSFPPFSTSTFFLQFISFYLPSLIATLSSIYITFKFILCFIICAFSNFISFHRSFSSSVYLLYSFHSVLFSFPVHS
jgi:hypothetical protein